MSLVQTPINGCTTVHRLLKMKMFDITLVGIANKSALNAHSRRSHAWALEIHSKVED